MTAIEYLKAKSRMTKNCSGIDCTECPFSRYNNGEDYNCAELERNQPEKAIEIVERWAKEHPIKTRQSEVLKIFPDSNFDNNGIINICPQSIYCQYDCDAYDNCDTCRAKFWSEEIV